MPTDVITENSAAQNAVADNLYAGAEDNNMDSARPTSRNPDNGFVLLSNTSAPEDRRCLFRFSGLSNIVGPVSVSSAQIYINRVFSNTGTITIDARRVLRSWVDPNASWNEYETSLSWASGGCSLDGVDRVGAIEGSAVYTGSSGWQPPIDVTSLVQDIINGVVSPDEGILLSTATVSASGTFGVYSSSGAGDGVRPELVVTYTSAGGSGAESQVKFSRLRRLRNFLVTQ